ncbi:MAG: polyprenyl synthetase family protein [Hyphomicrobium sp.]
MQLRAEQFEAALAETLQMTKGADCPSQLEQALHRSVFPGGKRIRPRLVLAVADACRADDTALVLAGAVSIELLHCASLVHDDLPCFDNASTRRGVPSIPAAYGERIAVLAGDALIVLAFESLAVAAASHPARLPRVLSAIARSVGAPSGIAAGQAWECEPAIDLDAYHRAKTGALFAGASAVGAIASGFDPAPWHKFGEMLGRAFQAADDVCDAAGDAAVLGKPVGRDAALARPNAVAERGLSGAVTRVETLLAAALDMVPECPGRDGFRKLVQRDAQRMLPAGLARVAA